MKLSLLTPCVARQVPKRKVLSRQPSRELHKTQQPTQHAKPLGLTESQLSCCYSPLQRRSRSRLQLLQSHKFLSPSLIIRSFSTTRHVAQDTTSLEEPPLSHTIRLLMRRIPHPVAIITSYSPSPSLSPFSSSATSFPSSSLPKSASLIPRGMTVSSFNTVTLHPKPVIAFNVRQPSATLSALQSSGRFLVHLLGPTSEMARLARTFSRGNTHASSIAAGAESEEFEFQEHKIGGKNRGDYTYNELESTSGDTTNDNNNNNNNNTDNDNGGGGGGAITTILPRLVPKKLHQQQQQATNSEDIGNGNKDDFTFILECKYLPDKSVQVYDHMMVLGSVERIVSPAASDATSPQELTYAHGQGTRHEKDDFCLMYADTRFWRMGEEF